MIWFIIRHVVVKVTGYSYAKHWIHTVKSKQKSQKFQTEAEETWNRSLAFCCKANRVCLRQSRALIGSKTRAWEQWWWGSACFHSLKMKVEVNWNEESLRGKGRILSCELLTLPQSLPLYYCLNGEQSTELTFVGMMMDLDNTNWIGKDVLVSNLTVFTHHSNW